MLTKGPFREKPASEGGSAKAGLEGELSSSSYSPAKLGWSKTHRLVAEGDSVIIVYLDSIFINKHPMCQSPIFYCLFSFGLMRQTLDFVGVLPTPLPSPLALPVSAGLKVELQVWGTFSIDTEALMTWAAQDLMVTMEISLLIVNSLYIAGQLMLWC